MADDTGLLKIFENETLFGLAEKTMTYRTKLGLSSMELRSGISVDIRPDGFIAYRGDVDGLQSLNGDGRLFCGPRESFTKMLENGGFTRDDAEGYLDQMMASGSAFEASVPASGIERIMLDAETLYGFDLEEDVGACNEQESAIEIFAAGTFEMPEMISHKERMRRAAIPQEHEIQTEGPS